MFTASPWCRFSRGTNLGWLASPGPANSRSKHPRYRLSSPTLEMLSPLTTALAIAISSAPSTELTFEWSAPAECGDRNAMAAAIARQRPSQNLELPPATRIAITGDDRGYHLHLRWRDDGRDRIRTIDAQSCELLRSVVAATLAVRASIVRPSDARRHERHRSRDPSTKPPSSAGGRHPPDEDPGLRPVDLHEPDYAPPIAYELHAPPPKDPPVPAGRARARARKPARTHRAGLFSLSLSTSLGVGRGPTAAGSTALHFAARPSIMEVEIGLQLWPLTRTQPATSLVALPINLCARLGRTTFEVPICVVGVAGVFAHGRLTTPKDDGLNSPPNAWAGIGVRLAGRWMISPQWALRASASWLANLTGPAATPGDFDDLREVLDSMTPNSQTMVMAGPGALHLALGLEFHWQPRASRTR